MSACAVLQAKVQAWMVYEVISYDVLIQDFAFSFWKSLL